MIFIFITVVFIIAFLYLRVFRFKGKSVVENSVPAGDVNSLEAIKPNIEITNPVMTRILLMVQPGEWLNARSIASRLDFNPSLKTKNIVPVLRKLCKMRVMKRKYFRGRRSLYSLKTGA